MSEPTPATQPPPPSPDDVRKHLELIQAVIARMSAASSQAKAWLLPVVSAAYGYALTKHAETVALLGMGAVLLFGYMDLNYLRQEKRYRLLHTEVAAGEPVHPAFSMEPPLLPAHEEVWKSWSIRPFYGALLAAGVAIIVRVWCVTR